MKRKVFISYAHQDKHLLEPILHKLSQISEFKDYSIENPLEISEPGNIREIIQRRVKAANKVVVFWTENAANSQLVNYEIGMADALDKPITVVKASNSTSLRNPNISHFNCVSLKNIQS